VDIAG
jgi:class 3 adenylate cyclase